jgi:hypothetical protein
VGIFNTKRFEIRVAHRASGSRARGGYGLALSCCLFACVGLEEPRDALDASRGSAESVPACLASMPTDLTSLAGEPPVAIYVNELRLGYARGEAIFLSRPLCELYGWPLCRFVELHERAHYYMKTVGSRSTCAETLADCYAAMHSDGDALDAALHYFKGRHEQEVGYHADSSVRLEVISQCASLPRRQFSEAALPDGRG